jgi:hypothetical protein
MGDGLRGDVLGEVLLEEELGGVTGIALNNALISSKALFRSGTFKLRRPIAGRIFSSLSGDPGDALPEDEEDEIDRLEPDDVLETIDSVAELARANAMRMLGELFK